MKFTDWSVDKLAYYPQSHVLSVKYHSTEF